MNCQTCRAELPEGSIFCPNCGTSVSSSEKIASAAVDTSAEQVSDSSQAVIEPQIIPVSTEGSGDQKKDTKASPSGVLSELPGFFSSFFTNPFDAIHRYSNEKYWIFGLLFGVFYILVSILFAYSNMSLEYLGIGDIIRVITLRTISGFGSVLVFASLLFVFFLLQKPLSISPAKNLKSSLACTGIAFWMLGPVTFLNGIFDLLSINFGLSSLLINAVYAIGAILLFEEIRRSVDTFDAKKSLILVVTTIGSMPLISSMIYTIVVRILY